MTERGNVGPWASASRSKIRLAIITASSGALSIRTGLNADRRWSLRHEKRHERGVEIREAFAPHKGWREFSVARLLSRRGRGADERIPILLQTPAAVRWISAEPLLEEVDLLLVPYREYSPLPDWVVIGGESGPQARPCDMNWIRFLKNDCQQSQIPVFIKQLGKWPVTSNGRDLPNLTACGWNQDTKTWDFPLNDTKGGAMEEWPSDIRVREYPIDNLKGDE